MDTASAFCISAAHRNFDIKLMSLKVFAENPHVADLIKCDGLA